jgi:integrase
MLTKPLEEKAPAAAPRARVAHRLTHRMIETARARATRYKLTDGAGLHLIVYPSGIKSWRLKFMFEGKPDAVSLGRFPTVGVGLAREKAEAARRSIAAGINPNAARDAQAQRARSPTFKELALEWHATMTRNQKWVARHADNVLSCLERDVFPKLGDRRVAEITSREVLEVVEPVAARARQTADRVQQRVRAILDHAALLGHVAVNPAAVNLTPVLPAKKLGHFESVPLAAMPALMHALESARGQVDLNVRLALRFLIFTVGRSSEIRRATWGQIDREEGIWRVPFEHMKQREEHWVPLTPEALAVLKEAERIATGEAEGDALCFPSFMRPGQPLSDVTLSKALHTLTPRGVPHGIRSTFSTWAHEQEGRDSRTIEMCLSHSDKDRVRAAYDASERLDERRDILAAWARIIRSAP